MPPSEPAGTTGGKCPICGRQTVRDYRPFCSRRCADVDLSRWLRGGYAIPDPTESEDGGEGSSEGTGDSGSGAGPGKQ